MITRIPASWHERRASATPPVVLLRRDEIEACTASPERLVEAITAAAERNGLTWA
jgi:hypothetical protein